MCYNTDGGNHVLFTKAPAMGERQHIEEGATKSKQRWQEEVGNVDKDGRDTEVG